MIVEALWSASDGATVNSPAHLQLVSRNVGVLRLTEKIPSKHEVTLRRHLFDDVLKSTRGQVTAEIDNDSGEFLYAFHVLDPDSDFWHAEPPAPENTDYALGRLLMECSVCHRREIVPLKAVDLRSFEQRRCIARVCGLCSGPSIWIQVQPEMQLKQMDELDINREKQFLPARTSVRMKSRLLVCIRFRGSEEEAVCEDLSEGGISFRSRSQYAQDSSIELSVPFTPGTKAIFVLGRIVFSVPVRGAGLFRHGVSYLKSSSES